MDIYAGCTSALTDPAHQVVAIGISLECVEQYTQYSINRNASVSVLEYIRALSGTTQETSAHLRRPSTHLRFQILFSESTTERQSV